MEIKYVRTHAPKGKKYTLGEIPFALGYAMEIIEPRPQLAEGKLNPGEMCMLLFALTPGEYALKDGDPRELDALADTLCRMMPSDRLIAWLVRDLKGMPVKSTVKPRVGASIDGGALAVQVKEKQMRALAGPLDSQLLECRRLQNLSLGKDAPEGVRADWQAARALLGQALQQLPVIHVAYDALLNNRWPAVGFDGRVEIFTTKLRAENTMKQVEKVNGGVNIWTLKEISGADVQIFFKKLENDGLLDLRVDNGFASAELSLKDIAPVRGEENAPLRALMLKEIAYGMRWNSFKQSDAPERSKVGALESMLSMRNFVWHTLGKAVIYAACDVPVDDDRLCTAGAYARLLQKEGFRVVGGERCLTLKNKQTDQVMLAAFTTAVQAVAFCERIGSGARPVAMTYDELAQRALACQGIVFDPENFSYRVMKQDFDKPKEMRDKPLTMVRIKPDEIKSETKPETKPAPEALQADPAPDTGSLPDPDAADAALSAQSENADAAISAASDENPAGADEDPASEANSAPEKPQQKGFFRRLFGK